MASRPHIDLIVDSLQELHDEAERDDKRPEPLGMRGWFVQALTRDRAIEKVVAVIRKRMREQG